MQNNQNNFLGHFLHGLKLKSYSFKKYKTKKNDKIFLINIVGNKNKPSTQNQLKFKALEQGTFYARDLVSEPGNVLHPDEYTKRINSLKKDGITPGLAAVLVGEDPASKVYVNSKSKVFKSN